MCRLDIERFAVADSVAQSVHRRTRQLSTPAYRAICAKLASPSVAGVVETTAATRPSCSATALNVAAGVRRAPANCRWLR